jgi:hypothetical protein
MRGSFGDLAFFYPGEGPQPGGPNREIGFKGTGQAVNVL